MQITLSVTTDARTIVHSDLLSLPLKENLAKLNVQRLAARQLQSLRLVLSILPPIAAHKAPGTQ